MVFPNQMSKAHPYILAMAGHMINHTLGIRDFLAKEFKWEEDEAPPKAS